MKLLRKLVLVFAAVILAATGCWAVRALKLASQHQPVVSDDAGPVLQRIQRLSSLTTERAEVADALVTELQGNSGSIKAVLIVRGEVTVGIDLSQARFQSVDQRARTALLLLPAPTVQSVYLDQEKTRIIGIWSSGLWTFVPGGDSADSAVTNLAYKKAQQVVGDLARDPELIPQARSQAERVITTFVSAFGWRIDIRWS